MGEEFTLESWVRPEGELKNDPVIFKEGSGHLNYALEVGRVTTGDPEGSIGTSASPNHQQAVAAKALEANVWSHLAVTFDGATLRLYVDGELVDTEAIEVADSGREGALKIGCDSQYGEYFKGRIDEVKLYNRALSGDEVQDSSPPRFYGGLKLWLNNTSGAEAPEVYFSESKWFARLRSRWIRISLCDKRLGLHELAFRLSTTLFGNDGQWRAMNLACRSEPTIWPTIEVKSTKQPRSFLKL
jgi:hypothetical protein